MRHFGSWALVQGHNGKMKCAFRNLVKENPCVLTSPPIPCQTSKACWSSDTRPMCAFHLQ